MGVAVQLLGAQPPDARKAGITQLEPAVAAKHGDALIEIIEGGALDRDLGIKRAFQGQGVGDVLKGEKQPTEGMWSNHHAHRRTVGLEQDLLKRLDEVGEHDLSSFLEVREISHFRYLACGPQDLEDLTEKRLGQQPLTIQAVEFDVGTVEELELFVWTVDDDGGGQPLDHRGMGFDILVQVSRRLFHVSHIKANADGLAAKWGPGDFKQPPGAIDNDVMGGDLGLIGCQRLLGQLPGLTGLGFGHQFDTGPGSGAGRIGLDDVRIGPVAIDKGLIADATPQGQGVEDVAKDGRVRWLWPRQRRRLLRR